MTTIITKNSSTASAAPVAGDLTKGELAVNVTDKKLYTKDNGGSVVKLVGSLGNQEANAVAVTGGAIDGTPIGGTTASTASFTTVSASGNVTLSGGTANGVLYLNGSKVATSGSALTFDGTNFANTAGNIQSGTNVRVGIGINTGQIYFNNTDVGVWRGAANSLSTGAYLNLGGYDGIAFATSAAGIGSQSEGMRLNSTGLGIGTSSPATKLHVDTGAAGYAITVAANLQTSRKYQFGIDSNSNLAIYETVAASQFLVLSASGNLGLGVTPSAWGSGYKGLQLGVGLSLMGSSVNGNVAANAYFDGTNWKYVGSAYATNYYANYANNGSHVWMTAPSGTAGNAITFTQAMTLDASGRLGIGQTSPTKSLEIKDTSSYQMRMGDGTSVGVYDIGRNTSNGLLYFYGNQTGYTGYVFSGVDGERARIDSSGNLLVGVTSQFAGANCPIQAKNGSVAQAVSFLWNATTTGDAQFVGFGTEASVTQRGSISYNRAGGLTVYNTTSDYRAKDIYGPVVDSGTLIDSVPVYMGKMHGATQERPMFIAHETPAYAHTGEKDAVDKDGNPVYQQMDASALIPVMWAELQSLRARVAQLESN